MMRKLTALLLVLLLAFSAALAETSPDGERDLGFAMLDSLYVEGQNRIISPASAQYALSMAALGAKGDTLAELLAALGAASTDDLTAQAAEGISCANIAFVAPQIALNADYETVLRDRCGAEIDAIDDEIVARANDWVREKTNGLIDGILNEQPSADTGLILMNAIAMDEEWALPFKASDTQQASFMAASGGAGGHDVPDQQLPLLGGRRRADHPPALCAGRARNVDRDAPDWGHAQAARRAGAAGRGWPAQRGKGAPGSADAAEDGYFRYEQPDRSAERVWRERRVWRQRQLLGHQLYADVYQRDQAESARAAG